MDQNNEQARLRANGGQDENFQRQRTRTEGVKYSFCFAFKQQLMRAWQPVPTLTCGIIMFFFFGIVFLAIGIALLAVAGNLMEFTSRYDSIKNCDNTLATSEFRAGSTGELAPCWVRSDVINIPTEMAGPVFVYYEITNFYQNHRKYFKSKSPEQLRGTKLEQSTAESECDPVILNKHLFTKVSLIDGRTLNPEDVAHPCGSMARSVFMDFFSLRKLDSAGAETSDRWTINSKGIAWPQDVEYKYKPAPASVTPWIDVTDERFMVWMRASATPTFRKLWGRIDTNLPAGNYRFIINNIWQTETFGGEKRIVLAQTNSFGGKNIFLGSCYIIIGGICIVASIVFLVRKLMRAKGILEAKLE